MQHYIILLTKFKYKNTHPVILKAKKADHICKYQDSLKNPKCQIYRVMNEFNDSYIYISKR